MVSVVSSAAGLEEHRDWALRHMGITQSFPYKGKGQKVGILDTGVDCNHQDLEGRVEALNFIRGCIETPAWRDGSGHGTFVSGEIVAKEDGKGIVGAAPLATAFHGRVLYGDRRDNTRYSISNDIADGIKACVDKNCGVISMSLGGPSRSRVIEKALELAVASGLIPVAAAGNERLSGSPYASYPAAYPTVISVAAADKRDMPAWFSTAGVGGDKTSQPEVAVASLEYYWGCAPGRTNYMRMVGTSQSTPLVAAMALLWREAMGSKLPGGEAVLSEFRAWLHRVSDDTNKNGWDPELGYGVLLLSPADLP